MRTRARPYLEQGHELIVFGALWETGAIESQRRLPPPHHSRAGNGPHPLVGQVSVCSLWLPSSLRNVRIDGSKTKVFNPAFKKSVQFVN